MTLSTEAATDRLFEIDDAFSYSEAHDRLFVEAMREMVDFHRARSRIFDGICRQFNYSTSQLQAVDDVYHIPHVIVSAFKERKILSLPESEIVRTFTSSGTGGQVSQINWDAVSERRQEFTRRAIIKTYGLLDERETNYIVFNYDPEIAGTRGAAYSDLKYTEFAPRKGLFWAIVAGEGGEPKFREDACVETLTAYEKEGRPLRLIGFPAFSYVTLKHLDERGHSFHFPPESAIIVGGGWKLHTGIAVSFEEYAEVARRVVGIPHERIRDVYGMVEHGIPYITCEHNHFHVPIWSRACTVDPATLEVLPEGRVGLLKYVTPYIRSSPSISVLSTDLGEVHGGCACGRPGRYLVIKGRGGVQKYAGCAISAAQLLGQ